MVDSLFAQQPLHSCDAREACDGRDSLFWLGGNTVFSCVLPCSFLRSDTPSLFRIKTFFKLLGSVFFFLLLLKSFHENLIQTWALSFKLHSKAYAILFLPRARPGLEHARIRFLGLLTTHHGVLLPLHMPVVSLVSEPSNGSGTDIYSRLWRYLRLIVNCFAFWMSKPIPLPGTPSYSCKDVTVIIPTLANSEDFRRCLLSISACHPASIIVVTPRERVGHVRKICDSLKLFDINILGAPKANKRLQMIQGLKEVRTSISVFADDDVFWPPTFLEYSLAPFEDPKVGASGEHILR